MTHPPRYDSDDPYLARLREICLALPESAEKESHGHPVFFTRKVFAVFGGLVKGDHFSTEHARAVLVLPDPGERDALLAEPRFFDPAYYGPAGWVGYDFVVGGGAEPEWDEVAELIDASYRNTALKRAIAALDARGG